MKQPEPTLAPADPASSLREELARTSRELEMMQNELNSLIYSISHDLRAPVRVILGFSDALAEDYGHSLEGEGREYLERIRNSTASLDRLLENMVELSRVSRRELRRQQVPISELAGAIATSLAGQDAARKVEVLIEPGLTATGDPFLLDICLRQLLDNAFKFTRRQPSPRIEVGSEERDGRRLLYVRDNGTGFDQQYAGKMFGAFQRLHPAGEFEGTGIGLAIVQRIAHRHGASVWAVGHVDQGATVYLTLS